MALEHFISELLYRYNCVIVPQFGAFLTQSHPAQINKDNNTLYPPSKSISFNAQLRTNDGLLTKYMAEAEKMDYDAMLVRITETVKGWMAQLEKGETLILEAIGEFQQTQEGQLLFEPYEKVNYLTSSFGLTPHVAVPVARETYKEEVDVLEERIPITFTPEKRQTPGVRPFLKYAAIFLLAVSTAMTGYRMYLQNGVSEQAVMEAAQEKVNNHIQKATFFDAAPLELPPITLDVNAEDPKNGPENDAKERQISQKHHHIIAGAFRQKTNAEKKIGQLQRQGFDGIYLGTNARGLHMVAYAGYNDSKKALADLAKIRRNHSKDAWLLSKK
ncbi:MAG: SPOR domain-containing protein [Flavobacteriaceae bacterium]